MESKKKKKRNKDPETIVNPEIAREEEEKEIETRKKDFHDMGGFPRPPAGGGFA